MESFDLGGGGQNISDGFSNTRTRLVSESEMIGITRTPDSDLGDV